jgi:hypothetical protein
MVCKAEPACPVAAPAGASSREAGTASREDAIKQDAGASDREIKSIFLEKSDAPARGSITVVRSGRTRGD